MREAGAAAERERPERAGRREGRRSRPAPTSFALIRAAPAEEGSSERSGAAREGQEGSRREAEGGAAGRAAEPPGTNELRADKRRTGRGRGRRGEERGGQGGARREKGGEEERRKGAARSLLAPAAALPLRKDQPLGRISLWEGSAFAEGRRSGRAGDQPLRRAAGAAEQGSILCGGRGEAAGAARSNFDMEFAFGYIGGESIHEEAMLPLAPSGRPRCGYKQ